jgi:hypothetical protein
VNAKGREENTACNKTASGGVLASHRYYLSSTTTMASKTITALAPARKSICIFPASPTQSGQIL